MNSTQKQDKYSIKNITSVLRRLRKTLYDNVYNIDDKGRIRTKHTSYCPLNTCCRSLGCSTISNGDFGLFSGTLNLSRSETMLFIDAADTRLSYFTNAWDSASKLAKNLRKNILRVLHLNEE